MIAPFSRPLYALVKPVGARCNQRCRYCYYTPRGKGSEGTMSDELLELFTRQYLDAQTQREVLFTWHGGEPTLAPIAFYERALALQRRWAGHRVCDNALQTNGTLLTDDWCRFLADNGFLVGISVDGPQGVHDAYRGRGTWARVMLGIERLEKHGVQWNAMATVNALNVANPRDFYRFFKGIGCRFLQFTPVVERALGGGVTPESVTPEGWGRFLCGVFDEWLHGDVGEVFVQLFEATLANWCGVPPGICSMSPACGDALVVEADGNVYSCDHGRWPFSVPRPTALAHPANPYWLGNISKLRLTQMAYGEKQQAFRKLKGDLPQACRTCKWLFACHGECPKNWGIAGEGNFLCAGYRQFFAHAEQAMNLMREELAAGREATGAQSGLI